MKKCNDCNIEMIDNCSIKGHNPFELGVDKKIYLSFYIPTNEKGNFLGIKFDKTITSDLKARVCPKCGKIELYVDTEKLTNN